MCKSLYQRKYYWNQCVTVNLQYFAILKLITLNFYFTSFNIMKPLCRTKIIAYTLIINIWRIMNYVRGEGFATILRLVKAFFIEKLILLLIAN